jgi:hypothetical protein
MSEQGEPIPGVDTPLQPLPQAVTREEFEALKRRLDALEALVWSDMGIFG